MGINNDVTYIVKRLLITLLTCFSWITALSQFELAYVPAPFQDTIPPNVERAIRLKLALDKSTITGLEGKEMSFAKKLYDNRASEVVQQFNGDYLIVDNEISPYLQSVLDVIYASNPSLQREASVYVFRSEAVNAMSYGEGTIAFTLGLLSRMESEGQIAFILCHELAHYHARHSDIKTIAFARLNYDKDINKRVKAISKSDYGKYTKYSQLVSSLSLSITKHGREKEFEADSLALQFYLNTGYDLAAPARTLQLLDQADFSMHPENIDLKKYFDFQAYPFKDRWLSYTESNTWHASHESNDTLQTHPSCVKRIAAIQRQLRTYSSSARRHSDVNDKVKYFRMRSDFEIVASNYHFEQFGNGLFNSLVLAERYPNNAFLHTMISQCLYQLYINQKNHTLGKVLILPDPRFEENYDRFLTFVHNLRLTELGSLSYYYAMTRKNVYGANEDFLYACWLNSQSEISQEDPAKIRAEYLSMFPTGKYTAQMLK